MKTSTKRKMGIDGQRTSWTHAGVNVYNGIRGFHIVMMLIHNYTTENIYIYIYMRTKVRMTFLSVFKYRNNVLEIFKNIIMYLRLPIKQQTCDVTTNIISAENLSNRVQYIFIRLFDKRVRHHNSPIPQRNTLSYKKHTHSDEQVTDAYGYTNSRYNCTNLPDTQSCVRSS